MVGLWEREAPLLPDLSTLSLLCNTSLVLWEERQQTLSSLGPSEKPIATGKENRKKKMDLVNFRKRQQYCKSSENP